MNYSIEEHRHRFSAWAASRAASVINCRFTVRQGKELLEKAGFNAHFQLPHSSDFDSMHESWRKRLISKAKKLELAFSHGIAAKLINVYLKSAYVCARNFDDVRVKAIHPPIDSVLLDALYQQNVGDRRKDWQAARRVRWSNLSSHQYQSLINAIKNVMEDRGLWEIEEYWPGHQ